MALTKAVTMPTTGIVLRYWRITQTALNHVAGTADVFLAGYVTPEMRQEGKDPGTTRFVRLELADIADASDLHAVTTAQLYQAIKAKLDTVPTLPNGQPGAVDLLAGAELD